jgi:hypothetical protein
MLRKQNSEKIFLQPIDQQYDMTLTKSELDENKKIFDNYEQNIYLNMSTDSETLQHNSFEDFYETEKISTLIVENWQENIEKLKNTHSLFYKNVIMQKMAFIRGSLNNNVNNNNRSFVNINSSALEQVNKTE